MQFSSGLGLVDFRGTELRGAEAQLPAKDSSEWSKMSICLSVCPHSGSPVPLPSRTVRLTVLLCFTEMF